MKTYHPSSPVPSEDSWLGLYAQFELLTGCLFLFGGGFYVRTSGNYAGVIVGATLVILALVHLIRNSSLENNPRTYETDRLCVRMKEQLPDGYALAMDCPFDEGTLDYLVVGRSTLFAINACDHRGRLNGAEQGETWEWQAPDREQSTDVQNPFRDLDTIVQEIRERLTSTLQHEVSVESVVLLRSQRVEGTVLDLERVLRLGTVADYVEEHDTGKQLDRSDRRDLEQALGLTDY